MPEKEYSTKVSIVVFGTDQKGEMFQEDCWTIQIARNWIKIRLRHSPQPGSDLLVFNKENGSQAEFVLDSTAELNEAKLLLRDRDVDIWQLDFGVSEAPPEALAHQHLGCARCGTRESAALDSVQSAELAASGRITRYCQQCLGTTEWRKEEAGETAARAVAPVPPLAPAPTPAADHHELLDRLEQALLTEAPAKPVAEQSRDREGAGDAKRQGAPEVVAAIEPVTAPAPPAPTPAAPAPAAEAPAPISWAERRSSRRIQLKTRARVRRANSSEVVQPINVSRGGICFESRNSYELDEVIWVAMHYREGGEALETPSRIARITRVEGGFNYGVRFEL